MLAGVRAADHDLFALADKAQPVGWQRLHPQGARVVTAVLLPDEEGRAVHVAHDARVDRRVWLADERAGVGIGTDRVIGHADGHARSPGLLARRVIDEILVAAAVEPRPPELPP